MPSEGLKLSLSKKTFLDNVRNGRVFPLHAELPYTSPDTVYPAFQGSRSFLFESVKGPFKISRYSFIGFDPYAEFLIKDGHSTLIREGQRHKLQEKPTVTLQNLLDEYPQIPDPALPPFQGGAAGLLSYDFVHYLEKLPATTRDDLNIPDAHFFMFDRLIAFDHQEQKAWTICCPGTIRRKSHEWEAAYDEARDVIETISNRFHAAINRPTEPEPPAPGSKMEIIHDMDEAGYCAMVERIKEYIAAGDIFQSNISLRVHASIEEHTPWSLYTVLREINPSPFAAFVDFGDYHIVSSSPERLVKAEGGVVQTRPIAGTRPRGGSLEEDDAMRKELLLNEKERAEHIMLIDLERNDLGRVCDYGSVHVDELMITEDYSHVIHIVSNIKGTLANGKNALDAVCAVFPGGTITGVPKVHCMEIIDELEPLRRGPYTGSIGYIGFSGNMDFNIIIRTFTIKDGVAYVQAGAGIVADSDPPREYRESLKKAEALLRTLEKAGGAPSPDS